MKQNKEVLVAIRIGDKNEVFSFKNKSFAMRFINLLKRKFKNVNYAITL